MTMRRHFSASRGAGFTLVEILIVIVIIGMLAGLTTTVLVSGRTAVKNSVVSAVESQLSMALDEYKNRFGEYPPDFRDSDAVLRHIKKRWPRYNIATYDDFISDVYYGCRLSSGLYEYKDSRLNSVDDLNGQHVWELDNVGNYVSSLVFWLGGLPDANGIPSGFYANPKGPLGIKDGKPLAIPTRAQREKPFFTFERKNMAAFWFNGDLCFKVDDYDQLINGYYDEYDDGAYHYVPGYAQGGSPFVYFRPTTRYPYGTKRFQYASGESEESSLAVAYKRNSGSWYEERRFQIIHPGEDGLFGPSDSKLNDPDADSQLVEDRWDLVVAPTTSPKSNCCQEDDDNIANFVENGTLMHEYTDAN